ncbi:TPA: hypothetical protein RJ963_004685 [Enterobacter hormaechei]|uniref:hypothetical protein n=1 Tax=Enterobacter hormaechei TaxID=158836 RepID=UPI002856FA19|nr:hypothetical protein [Enterobacter hormaechei]
MNYPNDKTKKLFKPFFELSDYLLGKLNVLGYTDYDLYRKLVDDCLKAYSTITYTEKKHSDLLRLIVVLRNRKYIPDYINYNTGVNLTNRFINYLESLILLNVMQANQTQKKKRL